MMLLENSTFHNAKFNDGTPVPASGRMNWLFCLHRDTGEFTRTDYTPGPGWMSDSFEGTACKSCGKILNETQTY